MRTNLLLIVTSFLILIGTWNIVRLSERTNTQNIQTHTTQPLNIQEKSFAQLPYYVQSLIQDLEKNNFSKTKPGYIGNVPFANNEKYLPVKEFGYYKKWEVYPQKSDHGQNTLERIITGKQGELYYTDTHYGDSGMPAFYKIIR